MKRDSGWRRAKDATKDLKKSRTDRLRENRMPNNTSWKSTTPAQKDWKKLGIRSNKVARARQLGFDYPRRTQRQILTEETDSTT